MFFQRNTGMPEGKGEEAPRSGLGRIGYVLTSHFFQMIWANILWVLFSLPLVTLPAASVGLYAVLEDMFRKGYGDVWPTFIREFKESFLQRTLITTMLVLFPAVGWMLGSSMGELTAYGLCAVLLVAVLMIHAWLIPQWAILNLKPWQALRNAAFLMALESGRNLLTLVIQLVFMGALVLFWPVSFLTLFFLGPALMDLLLISVVNPVLERRLTRETEEEEEGTKQHEG